MTLALAAALTVPVAAAASTGPSWGPPASGPTASTGSASPATDSAGGIVFRAGHSPVPEREFTVTSPDGTTISSFEYGRARGSAPTVVLVHGYPNTHAVFYGLLPTLARNYHVISIDTRGSGNSGHPSAVSAYDLDRLAEDVRTVVQRAAPGEKVTYVGHDFGGIIGWELLARPDTRAMIGRFITFGSPSFEQWSAWLHTRLAPGDQPFGVLDAANQMVRIPEFWGFLIPGVPEASWATGGFEAVVGHFNAQAGEPRESGYAAADGLAQARAYQANFAERITRPRYRSLTDPPPLISLDSTGDRFFTRDFTRCMDALEPQVIHRDVPGGHWGIETHGARIADVIVDAIATTREG